jgi:hypothetical protein
MTPANVLPSGRTSTLLLEREARAAALEAFADTARSGGGRFAIIEGSAGIGKTRLLAETRAIGGSVGMRVLAARGSAFEGEFAYGDQDGRGAPEPRLSQARDQLPSAARQGSPYSRTERAARLRLAAFRRRRGTSGAGWGHLRCESARPEGRVVPRVAAGPASLGTGSARLSLIDKENDVRPRPEQVKPGLRRGSRT